MDCQGAGPSGSVMYHNEDDVAKFGIYSTITYPSTSHSFNSHNLSNPSMTLLHCPSRILQSKASHSYTHISPFYNHPTITFPARASTYYLPTVYLGNKELGNIPSNSTNIPSASGTSNFKSGNNLRNRATPLATWYSDTIELFTRN